MNKFLSEKLKILSLVLIILVVFIHMNNGFLLFSTGNNSEPKSWIVFIKNFISNGIALVAVPLFFSFSGYLFFQNIKGSVNEFVLKIKKRIISLAIPYLLWSVFGLLLFFILQELPHPDNFFPKLLIANYSIKEFAATIFFKPIPYQLWFIRDLMVLVFLSPLIYILTKYLEYIFVGILFLTWVLNLDYIVSANSTHNGSQSLALFFFVIGSVIGMKHKKIMMLDYSRYALLFCVIWIALVFVNTAYDSIRLINIPISSIIRKDKLLLLILYKADILLGVIAIWGLYDYLFKNKEITNSRFYKLSSFSFFLYAFHEPFLTLTKKTLSLIIGVTEFDSLVIYILAPSITIFAGIYLGYYLKRFALRFYETLTGGR